MVPAISIIIPVYNAERYLTQCIGSILNQNFQDWECILIDDGSSDGSGGLCDEFSRHDGRIRVVHKANGGVSSARNTGIEIASGDWICFVDSDDRLADGALAFMLDLSQRTDADVCLCTIANGNNQPTGTKILNPEEKGALIWACLTYRTDAYASKGFLIDAPHGKLFRASIIRCNNLRYVEELCKSEDALFDAQFYQYAKRIVMDTHAVYFYTINPDSICHRYKFENIPMFATLLRHEQEFINKWYADNPKFKEVLGIRAFVAMEQVLYEAGAERLTISERVKTLRIFMDSEFVSSTIKSIEYPQIAPYMSQRSKKVDLFLAKHRMFRALCLWINFRKSVFQIRVVLVPKIKKIFHIDSGVSLSSLLFK